MLIYAQIEDAIIARIKAASDTGALGYRLAEVASYGGEFDDEAFFTQVRRFPAVWVTVGGSKPQRKSARVWIYSPVVAVMVGARNVRGERFTRHGSVGEPGTYQLLQDVTDLLAGQKLGLPIEPLSPGADRTLFNVKQGNEARSVFAREFGTFFIYQVDAEAGNAAAPDLTGINLRYYIKPGDDTQDASDELLLPE
jgi:phage gp37-like protein